jgi:UDP-N-acetyl-D-mannosaminuronate dehydrogenase
LKWVDLIIGHGEIGTALGQVLKESSYQEFFQDIVKNEFIPQLNGTTSSLFINRDDVTVIMHICIPYSKKFEYVVGQYIKQFKPDATIIHSTVLPGTTDSIYSQFAEMQAIYYSPVRGQHNSLAEDLKRYTKYFGQQSTVVQQRFKDANIRTAVMSDDLTLEWAKHLSNTLYYHWLIGYRQYVHQWSKELNLKETELWDFTNELHEYTGIQYPTYFDPKGIGGHCVLQNSKLLLRSLGVPRSMKKILRALIALNEDIKEEGQSP